MTDGLSHATRRPRRAMRTDREILTESGERRFVAGVPSIRCSGWAKIFVVYGIVAVLLGSAVCRRGLAQSAPHSTGSKPQLDTGSCAGNQLLSDGTHNYTVHFALDKFDLSKDELRSVRAAVKCATKGDASHVTVVGHTDKSGSEVYNLWLSRKRAETILRALVSGGVASTIISADWRGKFEQELPSDKASDQAHNRRVTIGISF